MKKIKIIVLIILLILGFVFQCEVFHMEVWNFNSNQYLSSSFSYTSEEEREALLRDLYQSATEEQVDIFATKMNCSGVLENELCIFGDNPTIRTTILENSGIREKMYTSLFSGNTNVKYHDFSELLQVENRYITSISYVGEKQAVFNVYEKIKNEYQITPPELVGVTEADMIYIIWGIVSVFVVLMTCIEIIQNKKEVVVRISMGEGVWSIIGKSIILEGVTDFLLFFLVRGLVFQFLSGEFMRTQIIICFGIGVALACSCYCSYAVYDMKMAFSNINDSKIILKGTYIIKMIVTAVSIITIVTNLEFMMKDVRIMGEPEIINKFKDYSYLLLRDFQSSMEEQYVQQIFLEYYQKTNPAICQVSLEDDEANITYVNINENAETVLEDFAKNLKYDSDADAVYFIPKKYDNTETRKDADDCLREMIINIDDLYIQIVPYEDAKSIICVDSNSTAGVKTIYNPVVVLSRYSGNTHIHNMQLNMDSNNVMFRLSDSDLEDIREKYDMEQNGVELSKTGVTESFEYHNNVLRKILAFCSSICTFALLLQFLLIVAINRMEYRLNAMELALKKVLGYGMWRKNGKLLWSGVVFDIVVVIGLSIFGEFTGMFEWKTCVAVGTVVMGLEIMVSIINILWIENKNVQKILKGGCL